MATDDVAQVADRHQRPADCALQATAGLNEPGQISGDARAASASSARRSSAMSVITISQRNDEKSRPERAALRLFGRDGDQRGAIRQMSRNGSGDIAV